MAKKKTKKEIQQEQVVADEYKSVQPEPENEMATEEQPLPVAENTTLPLLHIIVRTHRRPGYFRRCIESIQRQNYAQKVVHVIADDSESEVYAVAAMNEGLVDEVKRVYPAQLNGKFGDFNALKKQGLCKKDSDNRRHFYDLYLNEMFATLHSGWIFIVDDDKEVPDGVLQKIAKGIEDNILFGDDLLIVGQYQMKNRLVPSGENWEAPFKRGHIDMSCFVFHACHKGLALFDGHGAGDFRAACRLKSSLSSCLWIETPFTVADNDGNFGKTEKI